MIQGSNDMVIVGNTLLRWFYTVFDRTNGQVGFGQTNHTFTGISSNGGIDHSTSFTNAVPIWAMILIGGGVVLICGGVLLLFAIALLRFMFKKC